MHRNVLLPALLMVSSYLVGCASVPMATLQDDTLRKEFSMPAQGNAGVYIFRNSNFGAALKKTVYVDGKLLGETAPMTYYYTEIQPGEHKLSTESEFGENDLILQAESGKNHFVRQAIKMGIVVGGATLSLVSEEEGRKGVLECKLAK